MLKKLKMSKYNFFTYDNEENLLVYNFLTGIPSLTKIIKNDVEKFKEVFMTNNEITFESCKVPTETIDILLKLGILVFSNVEESVLYDSQYYEEVYNTDLVLTILPTGKCNFNCLYCFEAEKSFSRESMSLEAQKAIIKFVQRQIHKHNALKIAWFGGEPLLEPQIIKYLSESFIEICNKRVLPYCAEIVTNGFFLNPEIFDMLYNLKVYNYMVTIDGFKEQHDRIRCTNNGMGTYDVIMDNLLRIKDSKYYKFAKIIIRVNVTKSLLHFLDEFIEFITLRFLDDPRFSVQFIPAAKFSNDEHIDNIFVDSNELTLRLHKNEVYMTKIYSEESKVHAISIGKRCISNMKNSYTIAPDLNVYKCHVHYDMENNNIGYIGLNGDLIANDALHRQWYLCNKQTCKKYQKCNDCFYSPACNGGNKICPARQLSKKSYDMEGCPLESTDYKNKVIETVLYAANKYRCTTLVF